MKKLFLSVLCFSVLNLYAQKKAGIHHHNSYEIIHVVKKGETLSEIAEMYGASTQRVFDYNEGLESSKIKPNQVLLVPCDYDIHYLKNVLELHESQYRLLLKNEESDLYFDANEKPNEPKTFDELNSGKMQAGKVLKPKNKPKPRAAMSKSEYEESIKNGGVKTQNSNTQVNYNKPQDSNVVVTRPPQTTKPTIDNTMPSDAILHLVKTGETWYRISKLYGVTIEDLKKWNGITENNQLPLGENIIVGFKKIENQPSDFIPAPTNKPSNPNDVKFHVVKQGETLFKIAKQYNLDLESLKQFNNLENNNISVGQQILIPQTPVGNSSGSINIEMPNNSATASTENTYPIESNTPNVNIELNESNVAEIPETSSFPVVQPNDAQPVYHTVEPKETLFRIAKQYGIKVDDLRLMNNMSADFTEISPGDVLIVGYARENERPENSLMVKFKRAYDIKASLPEYEEMRDTGLGSWDRVEGLNGLFVLHKTAPKNTIIKLTNPMNNAKIYVKVIGELIPKIGEENVDIKLTTEAIKMLRVLNDNFRVKMNYHVRR